LALYSKEFPGLAREVQKGVGGVVRLWPKVDGVNVLVGSVVPSIGTAAVVDLPATSSEYSRVDVTLAPGDCPEYREREPLELRWSGDAGSGVESVTYDVVRSPLGLLVSLNQLREGRPGLLAVLTRLGQMLVEGTDEEPLAPQDVAPIYAAKARVELQDRFRQACRDEEINRLSLVIDRDRFLRSETALALAHCYEAVAKDPRAGTDLDSKQAAHWRLAWEEAWKALGPLAIDEDQDGEPDAIRKNPSIGLVKTYRG
jgi:hypothetical protein